MFDDHQLACCCLKSALFSNAFISAHGLQSIESLVVKTTRALPSYVPPPGLSLRPSNAFGPSVTTGRCAPGMGKKAAPAGSAVAAPHPPPCWRLFSSHHWRRPRGRRSGFGCRRRSRYLGRRCTSGGDGLYIAFACRRRCGCRRFSLSRENLIIIDFPTHRRLGWAPRFCRGFGGRDFRRAGRSARRRRW